MKILKKIGLIVLVLVSLVLLAIMLLRQPLPHGQAGTKAELLADRMLEAVNKPAWDSLQWIKWNFMDQHHYIWHKPEDLAVVQYGNTRVHLNLNTQKGSAWKDGQILDGAGLNKALNTAWTYWCNDSYWLNPMVKVRDNGTARELVKLGEDEEALLVTYKSGGVTPGDSYLYVLDESGKPKYWKMWVKILPITGIKTTFENYTMFGDQIPIAMDHKMGPANVKIRDVVIGSTFGELGLDRDPFLPPE